MTGMLASVNSLAEARLVLEAGVDIIDLKQPEQGALGALALADVRAIVTEIDGRCLVSATIGDLPMQPEVVFNAVKAMAETGVDYIKIGFFPGGDWQGTLNKLSALTEPPVPTPSPLNLQNSISSSESASTIESLACMDLLTISKYKLIAVLFADTQPYFSILSALKAAGFVGVMVDTMNKSCGSLTHLMSEQDLALFVNKAKELDLLCGLAGSLRLADVPNLLCYQPDYLGFRGALCHAHERVGQLNLDAVQEIKNLILKDQL